MKVAPKINQNAGPRVVVIGLDGATFDYIRPLVSSGHLPNLASLLNEGSSGVMQSTYPPYSAAAWISFMTGENPGKHGVFEFWPTDLTQYNPLAGEHLVSSDTYAGKTIFDLVGRRGKVAALRVPVTYPPWDVQGIMFSGYPSRYGSPGSVWPPAAQDLVKRPRSGKRGLLTRYRGSQDEMHLDMNREQLDLLTDLCVRVLERGEYSLFMVVYNQLDSVCHHFVRHTDPSYPTYDPKRSESYSGVIREMHEGLDRAVGNLLAHLDDDTLVVIMSDHGMGPRAQNYVHLNAWLARLGLCHRRNRGGLWRQPMSRITNYLVENLPIRQELRRWLPGWLKSRTTESLLNIADISWRETQAYRVRMLPPVEGIEINLKGRQPQGTVEPGREYEILRDFIIEKLAELTDPTTGEQVVKKAFRREEVHQGAYLERAPDIIIEFTPDYEGGVGLQEQIVGPIPRSYLKMRSGVHTMSGIFVARGPFVRGGVNLPDIQLVDVAPTILYYLGLPIPENMDGRVITEMFDPKFVEANSMKRGPPVLSNQASGLGLSPEDEEGMRDQLRGLGYL